MAQGRSQPAASSRTLARGAAHGGVRPGTCARRRRVRRTERGRAERTAAPSRQPSAHASYTIGYSNGGGVGNGFREEQVCTAKAEATALGPRCRADHDLIHRNTDAAGQLSESAT